ncbi:hypothetical protein CEXT_513651 [Caerostris extrusa]|uniref:Uncharacterized protein n=1 Tax=Caerostris extrusa TaxID=172846 RepID=A0AAV4VAL7_CAEEX|nr:hypothetical protein CEXT_513651 [Caerostris extrusa]
MGSLISRVVAILGRGVIDKQKVLRTSFYKKKWGKKVISHSRLTVVCEAKKGAKFGEGQPSRKQESGKVTGKR